MAWEKRGFIYKPSGEAEWMKTHAQVPIPLLLEDRIRIYIAVRPEQTLSLTTFIDVDIKDPTKILYVHREPILPLGGAGTFDEFGMMPSSVLKVGDEIWLYYGGWNRGHTLPAYNAIGLAVSHDMGKTFMRTFEGPVMGAHRLEPFSVMGPHVRREGGLWRMWYSATTHWVKEGGKYDQRYTIHYAYSDNGLDWVRPHICCIPGDDADECTVWPAVVHENGLYHMWFSTRSGHDYHGGKGSYHIGYATSQDGIAWRRDDSKAGIGPSAEGWDSMMIEYPAIIDTPHGRYMFYNGNNFGMEGFGYAKWSSRE